MAHGSGKFPHFLSSLASTKFRTNFTRRWLYLASDTWAHMSRIPHERNIDGVKCAWQCFRCSIPPQRRFRPAINCLRYPRNINAHESVTKILLIRQREPSLYDTQRLKKKKKVGNWKWCNDERANEFVAFETIKNIMLNEDLNGECVGRAFRDCG